MRVIIGTRQLCLVVIDGKTPRQVAPMGIIGHDDGLELRLGEMSLLDQPGGQAQVITAHV